MPGHGDIHGGAGQAGRPGEPGAPGTGGGGTGGTGGAGGAGGTGGTVTVEDWARWRRRLLVAFVGLALANGYGFWLIVQERDDRIDQAATVIYVRCLESEQNRAAIRTLLTLEAQEVDEHSAADIATVRQQIQRLPSSQGCRAQAERIRDLVK